MSGSSIVSSSASCRQRAEEHLIGDERVHPVNGDELLGQRVRRGMVIGVGTDDAAEDLVVIEKFEHLLQFGAGEPVPLRRSSHIR